MIYFQIYLIIGLIFGYWYSNQFIFKYMKKNNIPHPSTAPTLMLKFKQALVLTLYMMIAMFISGIVWPISVIEVIKNKGVKV
jgi:hypothetical protein